MYQQNYGEVSFTFSENKYMKSDSITFPMNYLYGKDMPMFQNENTKKGIEMVFRNLINLSDEEFLASYNAYIKSRRGSEWKEAVSNVTIADKTETVKTVKITVAP